MLLRHSVKGAVPQAEALFVSGRFEPVLPEHRLGFAQQGVWGGAFAQAGPRGGAECTAELTRRAPNAGRRGVFMRRHPPRQNPGEDVVATLGKRYGELPARP